MFAVVSNKESIMYCAANGYFIAGFYKHLCSSSLYQTLYKLKAYKAYVVKYYSEYQEGFKNSLVVLSNFGICVNHVFFALFKLLDFLNCKDKI